MATHRNSINSLLLLMLSLLTCTLGQDLLTCLSSGGVSNYTTHGAADYDKLLYFSLSNLRLAGWDVLKPAAIILPESKDQLAAAVRCSSQGSWTIRLRGGGHSFDGLSSYADGPFVIIDLMNLNRITIDLESETAWVEGGATLGELYYEIAKLSKRHAFAAGSFAMVGVGGQLSGGGNGYLARKYGVAADNVIDAVFVDAEGRVLDREAMGEDVFWAIRGGGGGGWGAVYAWKIKLLRVPEKITAFRVMRIGTKEAMAELMYKWQLVAPVMEDDYYISAYAFGANGIMVLFMGLYLGPASSAHDSITRAFPELGVTRDDSKEMSWVESVGFLSITDEVQNVEDVKKRTIAMKPYYKAKFDYVKDPIPLSGIEGAFERLLEKNPARQCIAFIPYGGKLTRIASDAIPFPHREGNLYSLLYYVEWTEEEDSLRREEHLGWVRGLYEYMTPFVAKNPRTIYVNCLDIDLGVMDWGKSGDDAVEIAREWGEKYFLGNYDRLVRIKTLIDPKNVFRHPQSVPPLPSIATKKSPKQGYEEKVAGISVRDEYQKKEL